MLSANAELFLADFWRIWHLVASRGSGIRGMSV